MITCENGKKSSTSKSGRPLSCWLGGFVTLGRFFDERPRPGGWSAKSRITPVAPADGGAAWWHLRGVDVLDYQSQDRERIGGGRARKCRVS